MSNTEEADNDSTHDDEEPHITKKDLDVLEDELEAALKSLVAVSRTIINVSSALSKMDSANTTLIEELKKRDDIHVEKEMQLRGKARSQKRKNEKLKKKNAAQGKTLARLGLRLVRMKRQIKDLEQREEDDYDNPLFTKIA